MTIRPELIERLRDKRKSITEHIPSEKLEIAHSKGMLSARERIATLFDPGTFQETGLHARHKALHFGMKDRELPADGVAALKTRLRDATRDRARIDEGGSEG